MKKTVVILLAVALLMVATTAFATIANTKHNLTTTGAFTRTTDPSATLCGFCHIPHGGSTASAQLPLWARAVPSAAYTLYGAGFTLSATPIGQPGTFSLTCLSCHDGTIGLGTITKNGVSTSFAMTTNLPGGLTASGAFQATNINATNGYSPYIGTDLQNDHPVGFRVPAAGYAAPNTPGIGIPVTAPGGPGAELVGFTSGASYPLFQYTALPDQFECATCHDPHLQDTGTTQTKFLRSPNAGFCQDCHNLK